MGKLNNSETEPQKNGLGKKLNCSIVKDLLPSYCDKLTSKTTNKVVEQHLDTCEKCRKVLREMNRDLETGAVDLKDEQIDYLKGYRKKRKLIAIIAGAATALILIGVFVVNILNHNISFDGYRAVDVDKFNIEFMYLRDSIGYKYAENSAGEVVATGETYRVKTLELYLYAEEYADAYLVGGSSGYADVYYKIMAKELPKEVKYDEKGQKLDSLGFEKAGLRLSIPIEDDTEHVYLTGSNREVREIWNRGIPIPTETEWRAQQEDND